MLPHHDQQLLNAVFMQLCVIVQKKYIRRLCCPDSRISCRIDRMAKTIIPVKCQDLYPRIMFFYKRKASVRRTIIHKDCLIIFTGLLS